MNEAHIYQGEGYARKLVLLSVLLDGGVVHEHYYEKVEYEHRPPERGGDTVLAYLVPCLAPLCFHVDNIVDHRIHRRP